MLKCKKELSEYVAFTADGVLTGLITIISMIYKFVLQVSHRGGFLDSVSCQTRRPHRSVVAVDVGHAIPRDHQNEAGRVLLELGELSYLPAGFVQNGLVVCVQLVVHTCIINTLCM